MGGSHVVQQVEEGRRHGGHDGAAVAVGVGRQAVREGGVVAAGVGELVGRVTGWPWRHWAGQLQRQGGRSYGSR